MAKKSNVLDKLKALPKGRSKSRTFMDELTPEQRATLLQIRQERKAGNVRCTVANIMETLKQEGYALEISLATLTHWLNANG